MKHEQEYDLAQPREQGEVIEAYLKIPLLHKKRIAINIVTYNLLLC
jgi:hypothetical protein